MSESVAIPDGVETPVPHVAAAEPVLTESATVSPTLSDGTDEGLARRDDRPVDVTTSGPTSRDPAPESTEADTASLDRSAPPAEAGSDAGQATEPDAPVVKAEAPVAIAAPVDVAQVGLRLKELFPALFKGQQQRPLKLRIQTDIQQRSPGAFSKQALSAFFRRHTSSTGYLIAVTRAPHRFDLDGQPAGDIADEHRRMAQEELDRRRGNREQREELLEQQRRNRATLLRDFERTTLTRANFCVLKGVEEGELDGLLAMAREELRTFVPPPSQRPVRGAPVERRPAASRDLPRRR